MKKSDLIKISVISVLLLIAYIPAFTWMYARWSARDTYYSHGFLVPFIAGFLVWQKRKILAAIPVKTASIGWPVLFTGLAIHGLSTIWNVGFTSGFSLLVTITGIILVLGGKEYLRHLWFPIVFLAFMIPLPETAIANSSFRLKIFAAQVSAFLVRHMGIPVIREGSLIITRHARLMVEDPCSGIRSLIALIALGALMSYFTNLTRTRRLILFASSVPIAVATNVFRIVSLTLIGEIYGEQYTHGLVHDTLGILVFVLAFAGLASVHKILE